MSGPTFTFNTNTGTFVQTGVSVTITPRFATSFILLTVSTAAALQGFQSLYLCAYWGLFRDGINVSDPTGFYGGTGPGLGLVNTPPNTTALTVPVGLTYIDLPGVTTPVVYTFRVRSENSTDCNITIGNSPFRNGIVQTVMTATEIL